MSVRVLLNRGGVWLLARVNVSSRTFRNGGGLICLAIQLLVKLLHRLQVKSFSKDLIFEALHLHLPVQATLEQCNETRHLTES